MSTNLPGNQNPVNDLKNILETGKAFDKIITQELGYPDIADLLAAAGTSDLYTTPINSLKNELVEVNEMQIPPYIRSKIDTTRSRIFMGILKEIERVWMSIDNCLYIWDYTTGGDISEYADQDQLICSIGIVKPRPGVFGEHIEYLLIIATALQIIPIGLSLTKPKQLGEQSVLTMIAANFAVPSDDTIIRSIVGTADARIFMVGHPSSGQGNVVGNIYELIYTPPTKWSNFSGQLISRTEKFLNRFLPTPFRVKEGSDAKDIFVDNERNLLYILSFNSDIEVINLADNGYISIFKHKNIIDHVQQMCRQQQRTCSRDELKIVSLHAISKEESQKIYLVAMTAGGFRLYFTGHTQSMFLFTTNSAQNDKPTTLELVHVRLPPPTEVDLILHGSKPCYNTMFYNRGTCLMTRSGEESDEICITALASVQPKKQTSTPDYRYVNTTRPPYIETAALKKSDYRFSVIEEVGNGTKLREISQQLSDPQRQFLAASTSSLCVYSKLRPVDMLERLIRRYQPSNEDCKKEVAAFFEEVGLAEACAMCLSIICDSGDKQVADAAVRFFFEFGGAPSAVKPNKIPSNILGQASTTTEVTYSGKRDGFALYLARLLGPIWSFKLFVPSKDGKTFVSCSDVAPPPFAIAKQKLNKLKAFMDAHKGFHDPAHIADNRFQSLDPSMFPLYLDEQKSMHELYLFLLQCVDSAEFAVFLLDVYTRSHMQHNSINNSSLMKDIDVNMILTSPEGRAFCHELVSVKIDETAPNTPTISNSIVCDLQSRCPVFFSQGEYFYFRGVELIRRALCDDAENERGFILKQSLLQFQQASNTISEVQLQQVCSFYQLHSFHVGVVALMLDRAQKLDPHQKALEVYENEDGGDDLSKQLFNERAKCYSPIFGAIKDAKYLSQPNANLENRTPIGDRSLYTKHVFDEALKTKDRMFHYQLYSWYIAENMMAELVMFDTEYLIPFFTHIIKDKLKSYDFLWQYHRGRSEYFKSAFYLTELAELHSTDITLEQRIKYLAFAHINCRCGDRESSRSASNISQLLQRLETLMKTSRFQARVKNVLKNSGDPDAIVAAKELDTQLFDENRKLYPFAERFPFLRGLFESENQSPHD